MELTSRGMMFMMFYSRVEKALLLDPVSCSSLTDGSLQHTSSARMSEMGLSQWGKTVAQGSRSVQ